MKTAVVLTGHLRCWKQVFPNFKEKVMDRYNPDIFIDTWDEEGWWIPGDKQNIKGFHEQTPEVNKEEVIEAYKPKQFRMESWQDYNVLFEERGNKFPNFAHRAKNIISMFYKLAHGIQLMEHHMMKYGENYNTVIRMRPDMIFHQDLPDFEPNIFYTLAHRNHLGKGTGDMIQVADSLQMILFSKISAFLEPVYNNTNLLCPHTMSETWIRSMRLPWKEFSIHKTIQHTPMGEYKEMN
jgi:hypothetical protein